MKKKILSAVLALCLAFGSAAALPQSSVVESTSISASAEGETKKSGNYEYRILDDGTAQIAKYNGKATKLKIPSTLDGKKVTSIGYHSFADCTNLSSITIPTSVTTIFAYAFWNCKSLKSVVIPKSVTDIYCAAFGNCSNLADISIPSSLVNFYGFMYGQANPFLGTKWLTKQKKKSPYVVVNGSLIDATDCPTDVIIPDGVKTITSDLFRSRKDITSLVIPNSVKVIGSGAFIDCSNLKTVVMADSVKEIGDYAFQDCTSLESIALPNGLKRIGDQLLAFCTNLKTLIIPEGVTGIGYYAFEDCTSLKSVIIPKSVKTIGEYAFGYYYNSKTAVCDKIAGFTISGVKGTAAEKYAKKNGFKFVVRNTTEPKTVRYAGSDRAETATKISKAVNAKTSDTVILATGFDFHDALAAVPLASAYNAPLLLADRDNLSAKTLAEIKRLKAKNIIVVASINAKDQNGKDAAIRNKVYKQLKGYKVTKLVGSSYYETAKKVAVQLKAVTKKNPTSVFITTDKNYADALSASPVAAILNAPIIYVKPTGALDSNTKNYLSSIKKSVKNIYIVGGVNAVSKSVEKSVLSVLGKKSATRFAGDDRYATCIKINDYFKSTLTGDSVCIAKGYNFPDALAGGVFAAKQKAPLFLADKLDAKATISKTQANYLYIKNPSKLYIFGGENAVPTALVKTIAKACV